MDVVMVMGVEKSAISMELYQQLKGHSPLILHMDKLTRFPLGMDPEITTPATGICSLDVLWNKRPIRHYFSVVPKLPHSVHIGADFLVRLAVQIDTVNDVLWTASQGQTHPPEVDVVNLHSGQTIPRGLRYGE